jgi:hypothetical protein
MAPFIWPPRAAHSHPSHCPPLLLLYSFWCLSSALVRSSLLPRHVAFCHPCCRHAHPAFFSTHTSPRKSLVCASAFPVQHRNEVCHHSVGTLCASSARSMWRQVIRSNAGWHVARVGLQSHRLRLLKRLITMLFLLHALMPPWLLARNICLRKKYSYMRRQAAKFVLLWH